MEGAAVQATMHGASTIGAVARENPEAQASQSLTKKPSPEQIAIAEQRPTVQNESETTIQPIGR